MSDIYRFYKGRIPILISMPHNGTEIPGEIAKTMTESAKEIVDTDWYMDKVYSFAKDMGCYIIEPIYSRYVIDLNRPKDDISLYPGADTTELCPTTQFDKKPIYLPSQKPSTKEIKRRVEYYWQPYHSKLESTIREIQAQFGYVLLFEAHSIKSVVPRFFEGSLPDFNFGTFEEKSCGEELSSFIEQWKPRGYSKIINGRFKGGYITRAYAAPDSGVDTLQLELSQATYLNESTLEYEPNKADKVIETIQDLFVGLVKLTQKYV